MLTGIRWVESARRSHRHLTEACLRGGRRSFVNPIIDWSNEDVWAFIRREALPYCSLYDEGFKRLGCMLCPQDSYANAQRDIARWPWIERQWRQIFEEVLIIRRAEGKRVTFCTGQELFNWWISRMAAPRDGQPTLFE